MEAQRNEDPNVAKPAANADDLSMVRGPAAEPRPAPEVENTDELSQAALPKLPAAQAEASVQPQKPAAVEQQAEPARAVEPRSGKFDRSRFVEPTPSPFLIDFVGPLNRYLLLEGLPIIKHIPLLNQLPLVRGLMKVPHIDFPESDKAELRGAINKDTVAFVGPNHPEFLTDWLIDKVVATEISPYMAHWADQGIVNADPYTQSFWLKNNLIANVSNGGGKEYSQHWALQGHGVLLHPEGTVHWTSDRVQGIFPGIVDMAMEAAKHVLATPNDNRPVYIVPIVWKLNFNHDASAGLQSEMKTIEKKLGLPVNYSMDPVSRFVALQCNILERHERKFGLTYMDAPTAATYFDRQEALFKHLESDLSARYGVQQGDDRKRLHLLDKATRVHKDSDRPLYKADQAKVAEMERLLGFQRGIYNTPELTQEHIAENLKRTRKYLVTDTFLDRLKKMIPVPVDERTAHIRSAGPIEVRSLMARGNVDEKALRLELTNQVREYMQARLDQINKEIAPEVRRYTRPNPFFRP